MRGCRRGFVVRMGVFGWWGGGWIRCLGRLRVNERGLRVLVWSIWSGIWR